MIFHHLKIALRLLVKNKWISLINIGGLAVGISVCLTLLLYVDYESSFDDYHSNSDNIYRVVQQKQFPDDLYYFNTTPYPLAQALEKDIPEISETAQLSGPVSKDVMVKVNDLPKVLAIEKLAFVSSNYFDFFDGIKWLTPKVQMTESNQIVLSQAEVDRLFGVQNDYNQVVNRQVEIDQQSFLIAGVFEDMPANSNYRFDAALSYIYFTDAYPRFAQNWAMTHMGTAFAIPIAIGTEYPYNNSSLLEKINSWKESYLPDNQRGQVQYTLQPLEEIHNETLYGSSPGGYVTPTQTLWIASGLAFLILFIAVLNFINLSTAQQLKRRKNVGVMKVLGTGKSGLIHKMLSEHALIIFIAMIAASLLTFLSIDQINSIPQFNGLHIAFDLQAVSSFITIGIVILVISTALPVLRVIKINTLNALSNKTPSTRSGKTFRSAALVMQFAILQIFLIGSLVVSYQMDLFHNADLGFNQDDVLIIPLPNQKDAQQFSDYLSQDSNVINYSFGSGPPMGINDLSLGTQFRLPQQPEDDGMYTELKVGDKNYAAFYGLELLAGKSFSTTRDKLDEFIVNESLIKKFNWSPEEAIGKKITINEGTGTITGVVSDYHNNALQYELTPSVIANWNSFQLNAFVRLNKIDEATLANIRKEWINIFSESSFSLSFLDEDIAREYQTEQLVHQGFRIAAFISILLGIMGLIGLLSFMIVNRSREIAIRKVLGSSVPQILNLISKEFLILSVIALLIAVPLTYYYAQLWLQNFVFHIDLNVWLFIVGSLVSILIVAGVCAGQVYLKAIENPTRGLKNE